MFIDSHCHLDFYTFTDQAEVIRRAHEAGVRVMINAGDDLESSMNGLGLAQTYEELFCTFGMHPNDADKWTDGVKIRFLEEVEKDRVQEIPRIVGIGETGLDYYRLGASQQVQEKVFREQIRLAKSVNLPLVVHCRDAFNDTLRILEEEGATQVDFHCYTGDLKTAQRIWGNGWVTSFPGIVSYPKNEELRRVVEECPEDLYFLETDAPFLPHQDIRGQQNEPMHLPKLAQTVAELRGETVGEVAEQSSKNTIQFFGLPLV